MTRVFVVGNAVSDVTLKVRRFPRPGESVLAESIVRAPGGKGLNQAVAAQRAGASVVFVSALGTDATASEIENALRREGFADLRLLKPVHDTDVSILTVTVDGENAIVTTVACTQASRPENLTALLYDLRRDDYVLMQGNLSMRTTHAVVDFARARGAKIVINAAPWHWDGTAILEKCEGVIANEGEMCEIHGPGDVQGSAAWLRGRGPRWVIVTLGANGCLVSSESGTLPVAGHPASVTDTSGAGDVFSGVLVASLARGRSLTDAIHAGQKAAAIAVARAGTYAAIPSIEEMAHIAEG
ncbi:PfkB family carbohydrate kinase [Robbsia sp. Bb-Pol-6]|uniref:Ribokinase n=1 Tax=Robbsia betulipollinis TaxID=2981849 RepID=A0ABT3ZJA3_9BURK|nr:PfkB family carbohydrate kinase [Robbsia betulipollinis]MCY0386603.1 PfkB family carbohydrate kinase [Robbsia betulipollinis]